MSEATHQLVRHAVEVNELPPVRVKGKADPVQIYEVVDLKPGIQPCEEVGGDTNST